MFLKYNVPAALCEQCTVRRVVDWLCARLIAYRQGFS